MPKTRVVNIRHSVCDVYIGRPSVYGNPFHIGQHGTRQQVIVLFQRYFENRIKNDSTYRARIEALRGKSLGCFCKPLECHGDIFVNYLEGDK